MAKNQDGKMQAGENPLSEGAELRVYELGFHLDPELPTEELKKAYQTMRGVISEKGVIVAESEPVKIQLAYTISRQEVAGRRDFNSAYFSWIVYETPAENHAEIVQTASADKRIIRFIDLSTTKDVARHSVEMRELAMKTPVQASEAVLGAELDEVLESATII